MTAFELQNENKEIEAVNSPLKNQVDFVAYLIVQFPSYVDV